MDLDRLYEFSVFAERGSVRAAARELGLAPATLSARLHAFEDSLNARLVAQEGNALRLTQEGRILLAHAGGLLKSYRTLTASMAAFTRHPYRRLRIALAETSLPVYLGPFLDRMNQTWPDVRIDLLHGGSLPLAQSLLSAAVDLYFTLAMDAAAPEGLAKLTLAQPFHHVLLPREHPLAQRASISLRELDGERFILAPDCAEPCVRSFQLANLAASGIRYTTYDSGTDAVYTKLLVPIGKGVLLMPSPLPDLPPGSVSVTVLDAPRPASACLFTSQQSDNPDVRAFISDFSAFIRRQPRGGLPQQGGKAP